MSHGPSCSPARPASSSPSAVGRTASPATARREGGIVLDLGTMKGLHIDPEPPARLGQAGLSAGEYTAAAAAHGLATPFGDTGSVGIAGLTLGRRHRLARAQVRPGHRRARVGRDRHRPTAASSIASATSTPTCSGRSVVAAATSGSSPASSSAFTRSRRSSAEPCSCRPPARSCAASSRSPPRRPRASRRSRS